VNDPGSITSFFSAMDATKQACSYFVILMLQA
jgi:hypothetical protein